MEAEQHAQQTDKLKSAFEWMATLIAALIAVTVVFTFFFRMVTVNGNSMVGTLHHGDRLVMITELYTIERGDVVVISRSDDEPLIKRVIAVAGDTISIDSTTNTVILNGQPLAESYVRSGVTPNYGFDGEYTVKDGEIFVMGDNRSDSLDSRQLGAFSVEDVLGETAFRVFPFSSMGAVK